METAGDGAPRALSSGFQSASSLPFSIIMSSVAFGAITIDSINRSSAALAISFSLGFLSSTIDQRMPSQASFDVTTVTTKKRAGTISITPIPC